MVATLILRALTGELRGREFAFPAPVQVTIGRSSGCTVPLVQDHSVSRQHCLVELDEAGAWVQDLGSLNGTLLNRRQLGQRFATQGSGSTIREPSRHPLHDGDE